MSIDWSYKVFQTTDWKWMCHNVVLNISVASYAGQRDLLKLVRLPGKIALCDLFCK